jgi:amidase
MKGATRFRSAFVPHELSHAIKGAGSGPLAGLTVAIKDMFDIAGDRAGGGNPSWYAAQPLAETNAAMVELILNAGGTIIGKTICDEFFYSIVGKNAHFGTPLNPRAPSRIPGGSSSGSASACAAGACDLAIGSDTTGSIRVPASLCGLYGIRTSHGRIDMRGAMSMAPSFDVLGWFSSSPGLFARAAMAFLRDEQGAIPAEVGRIRVLDDVFANSSPDVADLCRKFLASIESVLPKADAIVLAGDAVESWREALRIVQAFEVWQSFGPFITRYAPKLGPGIANRMRASSGIWVHEAEESRAILAAAKRRVEAAVAGCSVLAFPTCPTIAPKLDSSNEELEAFRVRTMRHTCFASISGLPQITVPIGSIDGAPVGLSFIGWKNGDEVLLALAKRIAPFVGGHN